jgi:SnoaL-like domain
MNEEGLAAQVRRLSDRAEIEDCIQRYCRGADRLDRELLISAYHDGATDDRGEAFTGSPAQFADWLFPQLRTLDGSAHVVCNTLSEVDGDVAHAESYVIFQVWRHARDEQEGFASMGTARYVDRLERRGGVWGIVHRECLMDAVFRAALGAQLPGGLYGRRDREDRAYARPLEPTPEAARRLETRGR